jgi:hypothetical protein
VEFNRAAWAQGEADAKMLDLNQRAVAQAS